MTAAPALMPLPARMDIGSGRLVIDVNFNVATTAFTATRLDAAIARFTTRLARQTGIPLSIARVNGPAPALKVECTATRDAAPTLGEDESYTLDVKPDGALLKAATVDGALRGLETFAQLLIPGPGGFEAPAVHIEDRPRFQWRGLMMDVSRHWMPVPVVERNLDAMAAVKLNVFHWHLSDDQGFRVESKRFPKLQQYGSDGHYYTQDEIRHIVAYARDRGIRVVPEFDVPGHTTSWFPGYPELSSAPAQEPYSIGRTWGIFDPAMDPTRDELYQFLDEFLGEMTALFPDPYFHIGGDEVNGRAWKQSESIQKFARDHNMADTHALQVYFNQRLLKLVEKYGKIMVGWDEILHPDLPKTAVIQSWRGQKSLAEAATQGYRGILSWGYYLDHASPALYHYGIDPLAGDAAKLTPEQSQRILGGEACMWAEYVNSETVDSRIWPRAAAIAERFWSPKDVSDSEDMYRRMEAVSRLLDWTGVQHRTGYQVMLDRIAAGRPAGPLRVLADVVEAQGLGPRARAQKYTSMVPLNRLVDAARPESETARHLELAAQKLTPENAALLRERFAEWSVNDARFVALAEGNALMAELKPLSKDLSALGVMGLQALNYLSGAQTAPADWAAAQSKELTRMQRVSAEVVLAATRPVKVLVDAVGKAAR
jgi:hexosaminidase